MNLLDYHRLQREERESNTALALEEAAREREAAFPEQVRALVEGIHDKFSDDLRTVTRGPLFETLERLAVMYRNASAQERLFLRSEFWHKRRLAERLESFGLRAAVWGLRERSLEMVRTGLAGFAIADIAGDVRETLMSLPVMFHAARELSGDGALVFEDAAAISGPALAAVLRDFARRPVDLQTLEVMGWKRVETLEGPGFQWGWPARRSH